MIQICFPVFLWHFSETYGYGSVNRFSKVLKYSTLENLKLYAGEEGQVRRIHRTVMPPSPLSQQHRSVE